MGISLLAVQRLLQAPWCWMQSVGNASPKKTGAGTCTASNPALWSLKSVRGQVAGEGIVTVPNLAKSATAVPATRPARAGRLAWQGPHAPARFAVKPLRIVRVADGCPMLSAGRMVISGRMADVCAELDRLAKATGMAC